MKNATIIRRENDQLIQFPTGMELDNKMYSIQKDGESFILTPIQDSWALFDQAIAEFSDDFFKNGREQPEIQKGNFYYD